MSEIRQELDATRALPDYEAVDVLWVALVKAANSNSADKSEHKRMLTLVRSLPSNQVIRILCMSAVDDLLNLDPPLETVLFSQHERLRLEQTRKAIETIRAKRANDPEVALVELGEILKGIRNKRAHGFKSRSGPRDREILGAARSILYEMCRVLAYEEAL